MGQKVQGSSSFFSIARDTSELAALQQQALTLWSLLLQCSRLRSRKAPKLAALQQASSGAGQALTLWSLLRYSKQAPEVAAITQQAPEPDKLRSLLRCNSKLSRSGACYCNEFPTF